MERQPNQASHYMTFAWGKNKDGELSMGTTKDILTPKSVKGTKDRLFHMITSGGQHSSAIDNTGKLYICGSYLHGKLGLEYLTSVAVLSFTQVTALKDKVVTQVACGDYHTLCLLEDGTVWTWGGTLHKKLGQRGGRELNKPGMVSGLKGQNVIYVDCGDFHSVCLTSDGKIFSWGGGGSFFNRGQCGHGHNQDIENPSIIMALKDKFVTQISCGGYHTLALTETNEIYAWGSGLYGECGFGDFLNTSTPRLVLMPWVKKPGDDYFGLVSQISAGGHHSMVLTDRGYIFSFGFGSHGQLGLRSTVNQCEPQWVKDLRNKPIKMIATGWNHTLVLTYQGDIFACGYGSFGQLGLGDDESRTMFTHVSALGAKKVERIYAGGNHSWALLDPAMPIRPDYEPPSPIPSECTTPTRSGASSPNRTRSESPFGISRIERMELPVQRPEYVLQVAYTDVKYCHRFVRFRLKKATIEDGKSKAEEFVHEMYMAETGVQYHRIQEDDEIIGISEENSEVVSGGDGFTFTCLLVCDPNRNSPPVPSSEFTGEPSQTIVLMKPSQLTSSPVQTALSEWIRVFLQKVGSFCQDSPKFFELRPFGYFMPM
jgi:alpha-tubulin suppressor-like RCC1 family protein